MPKTVDEYLEKLPEDVKACLQKLRKAILEAAPEAEEVISYQIPTYNLNGPLVHFAAFKAHCSFFGVNKNLIAGFADQLKGRIKKGSTTIHFTADDPLPLTLVKKIVKQRVKENLSLVKSDKKAASKKAGKAK